MSTPITYRGWHIEFDPPPIPVRSCDWQFWHDDFDGAPDAGDNRCGSAPSLEAAKAEIDEREDERLPADEPAPGGTGQSTKEKAMAVRAKLKLTSITEQSWGGKTLKFTAQYDTSIPEDQRFQKATPNASAEFQIDNPAALEQFALGGDYYVDFSPVPAPEKAA